jgi:hypothetical protein
MSTLSATEESKITTTECRVNDAMEIEHALDVVSYLAEYARSRETTHFLFERGRVESHIFAIEMRLKSLFDKSEQAYGGLQTERGRAKIESVASENTKIVSAIHSEMLELKEQLSAARAAYQSSPAAKAVEILRDMRLWWSQPRNLREFLMPTPREEASQPDNPDYTRAISMASFSAAHPEYSNLNKEFLPTPFDALLTRRYHHATVGIAKSRTNITDHKHSDKIDPVDREALESAVQTTIDGKNDKLVLSESTCFNQLRSIAPPLSRSQAGLAVCNIVGRAIRSEHASSKLVDAAHNAAKRVVSPETAVGTCSICFENGANACFAPCGHVASCVQCAHKCPACPVCREPSVVVPLCFAAEPRADAEDEPEAKRARHD